MGCSIPYDEYRSKKIAIIVLTGLIICPLYTAIFSMDGVCGLGLGWTYVVIPFVYNIIELCLFCCQIFNYPAFLTFRIIFILGDFSWFIVYILVTTNECSWQCSPACAYSISAIFGMTTISGIIISIFYSKLPRKPANCYYPNEPQTQNSKPTQGGNSLPIIQAQPIMINGQLMYVLPTGQLPAVVNPPNNGSKQILNVQNLGLNNQAFVQPDQVNNPQASLSIQEQETQDVPPSYEGLQKI